MREAAATKNVSRMLSDVIEPLFIKDKIPWYQKPSHAGKSLLSW